MMFRQFFAIFAIVLLTGATAKAGGAAFIGIGGDGDSAWGRDLAIRDALETRLGFQTVQLNGNTTPAELPTLMRRFLERPGEPGDRRLVWVSGPADGPDSPCPNDEPGLIRPAAATLLLVPECIAEFVWLPRDALHVTMRDMSSTRPSNIADHTGDAAAAVVITLPSDDAAAIAAANVIVLEAIAEAAITPAEVLQRLRFGLRRDGSGYTPVIDAAPASAAWSKRFLALNTDAKHTARISPFTASPESLPLKWPRRGRLAFYAGAEATAAPALWLGGDAPVSLLRQNHDGSFGYVRSSTGLFGWVRIDDVD